MKIAIVGASGLVGNSLSKLVADKFPKAKLYLFGNKSAGQKICLRGKNYTVKQIDDILQEVPQIALFVATTDVSQKYIPLLLKLGVTCIDNSSVFRMDKEVPLVVPCINGADIGNAKLIANPNCTTIQIAIVVNALRKLCPYKMTAVTMQAVSGAGADGLTDLQEKRNYGKLKAFPHPIFDNIIPQIGDFLPNGYTTEENKVIEESEKILRMPLAINSFCTRVPITVGHCAFVNLQCEKNFSIEQVQELLKGHHNILLFDDKTNNIYPLPTMLRATKYVGVGRVTRDKTSNGINLFVVADNLLRGASYNALEILEIVAKREEYCE